MKKNRTNTTTKNTGLMHIYTYMYILRSRLLSSSEEEEMVVVNRRGVNIIGLRGERSKDPP